MPTTTKDWAALRAPFPDEEIGHLPRSTCRDCSQSQRKRCDRHQWVSGCAVCNGSHTSATMHISYVGHADVTARLLAVDPGWTWEPMALDPNTGMPVLDRTGGLWIRLTVLGVTRPGYGDTTGSGGVKEAIGDALRNAAMRFGVALDLWAKGDRAWAQAPKEDATERHPDEAAPGAPTADRKAEATPQQRAQQVADWLPSQTTLQQLEAAAKRATNSDLLGVAVYVDGTETSLGSYIDSLMTAAQTPDTTPGAPE